MSVIKVSSFKFRKKIDALLALKNTLPLIVANIAVLHFKEGFKKGGGQTDASSNGWDARKSTSKRNLGRAILVDAGALKRDIRKGKVSFPYTEITAGNTPKTNKYAAIHNQGGRGLAWGKHPFTMPKREFIGSSEILNKRILRRIKKEFKKALN